MACFPVLGWVYIVEIDGGMLRRLGIDISEAVCYLNNRNLVIVWLLCSALCFFFNKTVKPSTNYRFQWAPWTTVATLLSFWLCPRMVAAGRTWRSTAFVIMSWVSMSMRYRLLTPWRSNFRRASVRLWKANRNYSSYRLVIRGGVWVVWHVARRFLEWLDCFTYFKLGLKEVCVLEGLLVIIIIFITIIINHRHHLSLLSSLSSLSLSSLPLLL